MTDPDPTRRVYRLRDYDHAISALNGNRLRREISISKIAATVTAGRTEVALWLRGERKPAAQRLFDLANALGYDLALVTRALYAALDLIREHTGKTWSNIAADTGLSPSTFTRIGQGHKPDADALVTLLAWLRVPAERFTIDAREDA